MANNVYAFTALTGGAAGALDAILGALLATGDLAFGVSGGKLYAYKFDSTSSATESSPEVIAPDSGSGRWLLATNSIKLGSFTRDVSASPGDVDYTGVGFKPTVVIVLSSLSGKSWSVGFGTGAANYAIYAIGTGSASPVNDVASLLYQDAGTNGQSGAFKTMNNDGFTITWTKLGSASSESATGYYLAFK